MKIVRLEAQDFKKLKAISINPDGTVVKISGANGAGKSSTLDAVAAALGGEKLCPTAPIRRGAEKAVVRVELDGDLVVERTFTAAGSTLKVMRKDGLKLTKPQAVLDDLVGRKLVLDPLAFLRFDPKKQAEAVRELAGVDLSALDLKRQQAYDQRTEIGRDRDKAKALASAAWRPAETDLPAAEVSAADLVEENNRLQAEAKAQEERRRELRRVADDYNAQKAEVARLKEALVAAEDLLAKMQREGKALKEEVGAFVPVDLESVTARIRVLDDTNKKVRALKDARVLDERARKLDADYAALTQAIDAVDEAKKEQLSKVKLPVEGLGFTAEGVTLNGLPFEQASQAEQLRVSMAVALAMNPKLPIALIRDASLLDAKSLEMVANMAASAGAQVWLEMVGAEAGGVVIEDGEVAGG